MKEYFLLQFKRNNRRLKDFGINPILGYILLLSLFIGISNQLFKNYEAVHYFYLLISLAITTTLSERSRNDFLKICFNRKSYTFIRFVENIICSIPFVSILLYKGFYLSSAILIGGTALLGLVNFKNTYSLRVPTPFFRKPFEFTVGFRKTFFLFPVAYFITIMAIFVNNFNLGVFALLLVFLTVITYYLKPENEFYVWSFSLTPEQFLKEKIKTALTFSFLLALPVLVALGISFVHYLTLLAIVLIIAYAFFVAVILAKYSVYPGEINLPQGVAIVLCLLFPPFLLVIIPYFFVQSKKKLSLLLHDTNK